MRTGRVSATALRRGRGRLEANPKLHGPPEDSAATTFAESASQEALGNHWGNSKLGPWNDYNTNKAQTTAKQSSWVS